LRLGDRTQAGFTREGGIAIETEAPVEIGSLVGKIKAGIEKRAKEWFVGFNFKGRF
jgi:hypothetical protein